MVYTIATMFATPQIEERFRNFHLNNAEAEIGGYFLGTTRLPNRLKWTSFKRAGGKFVFFIHSWVMLPNVAKTTRNTWQAWDLDKAQEVSELTAQSMGLSLLHFHSHPNGNIEPSNQDLLFWSKWCDGEGVIVTGSPLRLTNYNVQVKRAGSTADVEMAAGDFFTWRTKNFRYLWNEMSGS